MPPSVSVNINNKTSSVSHDRMSSSSSSTTSTDDHLTSDVNKVKMFDPLPDHVKKPPVPMRRIGGRRTWGQKGETRSELMSSKSMVIFGGDVKNVSTCTSPRLLRKVKSTPSRSELVSKLSNENGIGIAENVGSIGKSAAESVENPLFEELELLIEKDLNVSDENCEEKKINTSNVDGNECLEIDEIGVEIKRCEDIKEVRISDTKLRKSEDVKVCETPDEKAIVAQSALAVKQPPPPRYVKRSAFYTDINKSSQCITKASKCTKPNPSFSATASSIPQQNEFQRHTDTRDRMQSLVDLVMWRDVSRSTFVFGAGIFIIISSSYTQDINISFISVTSYMGLAYLALIFIFRSMLQREVIHVENGTVIIGEEEAIWIVKLVLPYVNEFIVTLKALFSGDPATTMKVRFFTSFPQLVILIYEVLTESMEFQLALVLFILAKCGSSITIWKLAKLGFIGVFTLPKLVTLYSLQLKSQCKFWIERFRDAWETCSHKKVLAGIVFSLVWNLCSVVARIWTLFMMVVAFRYYQQLMAGREDDDVSGPATEQEGRVEDTSTESSKEKKET